MTGKKREKRGPEEEREADVVELQRRIEALGGSVAELSDDLPVEIQEQFLRNVLAYEEAEEVTLLDQLREGGVEVRPPGEIGDEEIHDKLWELIHALALLDVYLLNTDHLGDRELYQSLWDESLREPGVRMPPGGHFTIDLVGSGSEEDTQLYLKYYADERWRRDWAREWPDDPMPERRTPPQDRDRRLPQPEMPGGWAAEAPEPQPRKAGKVGRNDPCPCGSGKKYKKCCRGRSEAGASAGAPSAPRTARHFVFEAGSYQVPGGFLPSLACLKVTSPESSEIHFVLVQPEEVYSLEEAAVHAAEEDLEAAFERKRSGGPDAAVAEALRSRGYLSVTGFQVAEP